MKISTLALIFSLVSFNTSFSQQFAVRYNGSGNGIDVVKAMIADNAGNTYIAGSSYSGANGDDFIVIKYNASGVKQWAAKFNGTGNGSDIPNALFADVAGNIYVTGYSDQLTGAFINNDATTVKFNSQGVQVWVAKYDGAAQRNDAGNAIKADGSGNVYITGYATVRNGAYTKKDYLTIKYNSTGAQQWVATYNGPANQDDAAIGLALDGPGNVYVTGTSFAGADPLGEQDYLTIKYNSTGMQQWASRYNGPAKEPDVATGIAVDNAGNSYVTGYSQDIGLDFATIKYNTNGMQQWVARYNGIANGSDLAYAIVLDISGNIYVTGSDQSTEYNSDFRTVKYNPAGTLQWTAGYNGPANDNDEAKALAVDANGNVYVTGYINGTSPSWDIASIKYDATGKQQWVKTYDGPAHGNDNGSAIATDGSGNVYVAGTSAGIASELDFITIKYPFTAAAMASNIASNSVSSDKKLGTHPNPVRDKLTIQLPITDNYTVTVFDNSGKKLFEQNNICAQTQIDFSRLSSGIFFLKVTGNKTTFTQKIIKE